MNLGEMYRSGVQADAERNLESGRVSGLSLALMRNLEYARGLTRDPGSRQYGGVGFESGLKSLGELALGVGNWAKENPIEAASSLNPVTDTLYQGAQFLKAPSWGQAGWTLLAASPLPAGVLKRARGVEVEGFHGSPGEILGELDPGRAVETEGAVFFASNEDVAYTFTLPREYGESVYYLDELDDFGEPIEIEPGPVVKRRLRFESPLVIEGEEAQRFIDDTTFQGRVIEAAKEKGHDGVIARGVMEGIGERYEGDVYAVFSRSQIGPR